LSVVAVVNNFLYLMLDLLLADGAVRIGGVLGFGFLLAVKRFEEFFVGRFLFFLEGSFLAHNRLYLNYSNQHYLRFFSER
jgi:hypothetical protein